VVGGLPLDTATVSERALEGLPNADVLARARTTFDRLSEKLRIFGEQLATAIKEAEAELATSERRQTIEATYERLLRELQKSKIDGEEFIRLRRQIESLAKNI
jgi:hypothetical protein